MADEKRFAPGDIVEYPGGIQDYLMGGADGELYVNAVSDMWLATGLLAYGEQSYVFGSEDRELTEVVGHYGTGSASDGAEWYMMNRTGRDPSPVGASRIR